MIEVEEPLTAAEYHPVSSAFQFSIVVLCADHTAGCHIRGEMAGMLGNDGRFQPVKNQST
jgi:hypothetical protein